MAKGKRSGRRAEDVIASHAMQHHDFIGGARAERTQAQEQKEAHLAQAGRKDEDAIVREMARELEKEAGLRPQGAPPTETQERGSGTAPAREVSSESRERAAAPQRKGLLGNGMRLLEDARDDMPRLLEALRLKAEERLAGMPRPFKVALHRSEQAAALLVAPARIGFSLARQLLTAPLRILGLRRREA